MVSMSKAKPEKKSLPKRFYAAVDIKHEGAAFSITLDGKLLRTQGRHLLQVDSIELAEAIAEEWREQLQHIDPDTMPLTRLINLTIDRAGIDRAAWVETIVAFAETDLLCYRADAQSVRGLRQKQDDIFTPLLAWAGSQGVMLNVTDSIMPVTQPQQSLTILRSMIEQASDHEIAALAILTPLLGSAILTLAVWRKHITIEEALIAARLDEQAQAEQWGEDDEAEAAWAAKCRDAHAASFFLGQAK
jgi:chaperone required for assembly of F1-ATPase